MAPRTAPTELTFTMVPEPLSRMCGSTILVRSMGPKKLLRKTSSTLSGSLSSMAARYP